jgi:hypothetical protein
MLESELPGYRVGNHLNVTGHLSEGSHNRSDNPPGLTIGIELRIEAATHVAPPGIE